MIIVYEGSESLFDGLVLLLNLVVGLRVEGGAMSVVDTNVEADSICESAGDQGSAVGDGIGCLAELADHVLEKRICHFW